MVGNISTGDVHQAAVVRGIGVWLAEATVGTGVTVDRLLSSPILTLCATPPDWSRVYAASAVLDLVRDTAQGLPEMLDVRIASAALNLDPEVDGGTRTARFRSLTLQGVSDPARHGRMPTHPSSIAKRWSRIRQVLAENIWSEIVRRNDDGWDEYGRDFHIYKSLDLQPFVVRRLEVTYFIDHRRVCTETITQRWLSVDLSYADGLTSIDHYKVRAMYMDPFDDEAIPVTKILPMLNCRAGDTELRHDGWLTTPMYFPRPMRHGESVFFASRVEHATAAPMDPSAFIQVTSLGIMELIMRVQFHPDTVPTSCWVYGGSDIPDRGLGQSGQGQTALRTPNDLGYVEYRTENCPAGWFYMIGWKWD